MRVVVLVGLLLGAGCETVKPWERDLLSLPEMQDGSGVVDAALNEQVYFSKEGSSGRAAASGAGCGCN